MRSTGGWSGWSSSRIEAALTDEGGRRGILERDLAVLKERVGLIQARIAEIERRLGA